MIASLIAPTSTATTGTAGAAGSFSDVPVGSIYAEAVDWLVDQGVTTGRTATDSGKGWQRDADVVEVDSFGSVDIGDIRLQPGGDGLSDWLEFWRVVDDRWVATNILDPDSDGDGYSDGEEVNVRRTDPLTPD